MDKKVSVNALSEEELHEIEMYVNDKFRNGAGFNCSQTVASYFAEKYGIDGDILKKISCGFGGGMRKGEVCGAVTGGIMGEKKIIRFAWISIALGIIMLVIGNVFDGNPVIDFIEGALPWMLLALTILFEILYLNKEDRK